MQLLLCPLINRLCSITNDTSAPIPESSQTTNLLSWVLTRKLIRLTQYQYKELHRLFFRHVNKQLDGTQRTTCFIMLHHGQQLLNEFFISLCSYHGLKTDDENVSSAQYWTSTKPLQGACNGNSTVSCAHVLEIRNVCPTSNLVLQLPVTSTHQCNTMFCKSFCDKHLAQWLASLLLHWLLTA